MHAVLQMFHVKHGAAVKHMRVILSRQAKNLVSYRLGFVLLEFPRFAQNEKLGVVGGTNEIQDLRD